MAKLIVDLPRDWEAKVTPTKDGSRIEIEPAFVAGSSLAPCLYLTTQGEGGMERRAVVMFNGNTGWPETRRVKEGGQRVSFDLTPDEYAKRKDVKEDEENDGED